MKRKAHGVLLIVLLGIVGIGAIFNPGTQPGQGVRLLLPANCECHDSASSTQIPDWQGSMMAQAQRDLTYLAQLDISNYDVPGSGEYCIRCHTPRGWLEGRSEPPDASALIQSDREGVTCHYCHSMVDPLSPEAAQLGYAPVSSYGNGQFTLAGPGDYSRRIPGATADCPHPTNDSPFHSSGDLCGTCHDVSNPLMKNPWDPWNVQKQFCIERTYSEWKLGHYAATGETCQDCHMDGGHFLNGANTWVAKTIPTLFPDDSVNEAALQDGIDRAIANLQEAAVINVSDISDIEPGKVSVYIENQTGHKLITGYPEGRRMWINVTGYNASGYKNFESGSYNFATATLALDDQVKVYENKPGVIGPNGCVATFHFVLNNCISKDNRIPPRGFGNAVFAGANAAPVGYPYADGQYWDYTNYQLPAGTAKVDVTLYYQSTSREYIEFLNSAPGSGKRGQILYNAWVSAGKSEPVAMATVTSFVIDNDLDGMANAWETSYGLDPNSATDGLGDPDADGLTNAQEYTASTLPGDADTDNDGLTDGEEVELYWTDPTTADTDADGLNDQYEVLAGTDPIDNDLVADPDGDGLSNLVEYQIDLLLDGTVDNNPSPTVDNGTLADTDGDSLPDFYEVAILGGLGASPSSDGDSDGLTNLEEYFLGTDPAVDNGSLVDGDLDLIPDVVEAGCGCNQLLSDGQSDADGDGIPNLVEYRNGTGACLSTDAFDTDVDDDFIPDLWETGNGITDALADPDGDGVINLAEYLTGSDPNVADLDTDLDGQIDGWETVCGLDPAIADGSLDLDGDGIPAGLEFLQLGYDGVAGGCEDFADEDGDGMSDYWEFQYGLDPASADATSDPDFDGIINGAEYRNGSDPTLDNALLDDLDADGLPDYWETIYFADTTLTNGITDDDGDGISNLEEYQDGTNPLAFPAPGIFIDPSEIKIRVGKDYQMTIIGTSDVSWMSSNVFVGDIEPEAGVFHAYDKGTTTITAVTLEGELYDAQVTVIPVADSSSSDKSDGGCSLSGGPVSGDHMLLSLILVMAPFALSSLRRRYRKV